MTNHVVSLDLAKRLKTAGYPQESEFYWILRDELGSQWELSIFAHLPNRGLAEFPYAAPLATELLERLPHLNLDHGIASIQVWSDDLGYRVFYKDKHWEASKSLPDALASMYLYLVDNGYIINK